MEQHQVILFDGVCNFCNFLINFIIKRDKKDLFRFAALQSESGRKLLDKFDLNKKDFDTIILIDGESFYIKSTAALKIAKSISGLLKILYVFVFLPGFLRDCLYDLITKTRYKLLGKRGVCRVPREDVKKKFLED